LLNGRGMETQQSPYYAEILILVDGWPWNLSEFDFRRFFAPGSCPRALQPVAAVGELHTRTKMARVSENRRVAERRGKKRDRRRHEQSQARQQIVVAAKPSRNKKARRAQVEALARAVLIEKAA
jgi:hypothetical protein